MTAAQRITDPDDRVTREIATALRQQKCIVPILVDGAEHPLPSQMHESMAGLSRLLAVPSAACRRVRRRGRSGRVRTRATADPRSLVRWEALAATVGSALSAVVVFMLSIRRRRTADGGRRTAVLPAILITCGVAIAVASTQAYDQVSAATTYRARLMAANVTQGSWWFRALLPLPALAAVAAVVVLEPR
jgi:hypothetical protein